MQRDGIPVARDHIHGVLWCDACATRWCARSIDSGMPSLLLDPRITRFTNLKNLWVLFFVGLDVIQFRDRYPVVRDLRCHHSVSQHPRLAASVAVRAEPLGQDHFLDAHHQTTVRLASIWREKNLL